MMESVRACMRVLCERKFVYINSVMQKNVPASIFVPRVQNLLYQIGMCAVITVSRFVCLRPVVQKCRYYADCK